VKWNKKELIRLKKLYYKSVSIQEIAYKLKRTTGAVEGKLRFLAIRRNRSFPKLRLPSQITPSLARIHAHVCGDGNLFKKKEKDSYGYLGCYKPNSYRYRYGIEYTNMNFSLIKEFMRDAKLTFGLKPYYRENCVRVKSIRIWKLLRELGAGKSHDWSISPKITKANKEIKKNWIRAFFDDEACFNSNGRIRVRSVNRKGLTQVMKMLRGFVPCHITPKKKNYPDGSVYLNINKIDAGKYFSKIGSLRYSNDKGD
jgi:hypothetical protein